MAPQVNLNEGSDFLGYLLSVKRRNQSSNNRYVKRRPVILSVNKMKHVNHKIVITGGTGLENLGPIWRRAAFIRKSAIWTGLENLGPIWRRAAFIRNSAISVLLQEG